MPVLNEHLKARRVLEELDVEFVVPTPNDQIYSFEGKVNIIEGGTVVKSIAADFENTIWSGCNVSQGDVVGMVIYNGCDSKIMMGTTEAERKRSMVTDELNDYSKILFLLMLILSLILRFLKGGDLRNIHIQLFRYMLLLSTIIPISMKVNHDISRLYYSSRINSDIEISGCQARNSNTCEDLGRIEYFLTDKTGTLTKNIMIVRKIFVNGIGQLEEKDFKNALNLHQDNLQSGLADFCACMMVCHSVSPSRDSNGKRVLESASPDEISFIEMMERDGLQLKAKNDQGVTYIDEQGQLQSYKVLLTFPFTSERKRMGIICQKEGQEDLIFFLKGADSSIKPKLDKKWQDLMMGYAEKLSLEGLRTLTLAGRRISPELFRAWRKEFEVASASLKRRNEKVEACIEQLERDMDFIGVD